MSPSLATHLPQLAGGPGSRTAWLTVAAAFIAGFVVFGVMYSFGAFFEPMAAEFHANRAATSAFFSITGFIFYMSGSLTGYLSDRYGPRAVVGAGAVIMGGGLMLTAFAKQIWLGYVSYGVGVGVARHACTYRRFQSLEDGSTAAGPPPRESLRPVPGAER